MAKTILVADDSKTIRHVVQLTFQATEFRVVAVDSAMAAVERARTERPDLVLADIGMPGVDGYRLCQTLKAEGGTSHIPVLLMAGAFEAFDEARAATAKADGHIKKPFETQKLIDQVKALTGTAATAPIAPTFAASLAAKSVAPPPPAAQFKAPAVEPAQGRSSFDPFGAPPPSLAPAAGATPKKNWEEEPIEEDVGMDDEGINEAAVGSPGYGPALEPPTPPDAEAIAARGKVDVWALQDEAPAGARPQGRTTSDLEARPSAAVRLAPAIANAAAPAVAAQAAALAPGIPRDVLLQAAREVIEQIAWEVVPELAETIIREEIRRLLAERG